MSYARDEQLLGCLLELSHGMQSNFERVAADYGLSAAEARALHRLAEPEPMRALADGMHCDASYITGITDRLESAGLVRREADPSDRRVRRLALTDDGRAVRADFIADVHASTAGLAGLDEAERDTLLALAIKTLASQQVPAS